jgi:hypothetical protein
MMVPGIDRHTLTFFTIDSNPPNLHPPPNQMPPLRFFVGDTSSNPSSSSATTTTLPSLTVGAPRPLPTGPCLWDTLRAAPRLVDDAFWLGLRYAADREVRPHLRFALFAQGFLRLFVLPRPEERSVRCLVLTRRAAMARDIEQRLLAADAGGDEYDNDDEEEEEEDALLGLEEDPPFLELLRACAMGPTAGSEWPASGGVSSATAAVAAIRGQVVTSGVSSGGRGFHLHDHQRASLAWMRAVEAEGEEGAVVLPLGVACPPVTVDGDLLVVDCHGAVRTRRQGRVLRRRQDDGDRDAADEVIRLPRGGLLAHPVGAGKTAIAASLLLPSASSTISSSSSSSNTLILAPDHILFQWRRELARVLWGHGEGQEPSFVLLGFEELLQQQQQQQQQTGGGGGMGLVQQRRWGRLIVDEGQLVQQDEALYEAVLNIQADVRW